MSSKLHPNLAVEFLLDGIAPEREDELRQLWATYSPYFSLTDDGPSEVVLDGGPFSLVRFNHRAMRLYWIGSYIAWEGFTAIQAALTGVSHPLDRFRDLISTFDQILAHDDPAAVPIPEGIPEPGTFPPTSPETRAPAEIAALCAGWALLHEFKHVQHRRDGTAVPEGAPRDLVHAEEFSCDEFATRFILERVAEYANAHSELEETVRLKRQTGIYFALFTMALLSKNRWSETDSHPALLERVRAIQTLMDNSAPTLAEACAFGAFQALRSIFPDAPDPFRHR